MAEQLQVHVGKGFGARLSNVDSRECEDRHLPKGHCMCLQAFMQPMDLKVIMVRRELKSV